MDKSLFKGRISSAIQLAGTREALVLAMSQRGVVNTVKDLPIRPQILRGCIDSDICTSRWPIVQSRNQQNRA